MIAPLVLELDEEYQLTTMKLASVFSSLAFRVYWFLGSRLLD